MPKCTFCGNLIEKGTGKIFIYVSGKQAYFCSGKCEKNMLKLKRKPLQVKWTETYRKSEGKDNKVVPKVEETKVVEEVKGTPATKEAEIPKAEEKKEVEIPKVKEAPKEETTKAEETTEKKEE